MASFGWSDFNVGWELMKNQVKGYFLIEMKKVRRA